MYAKVPVLMGSPQTTPSRVHTFTPSDAPLKREPTCTVTSHTTLY
jgi:hypothetical protein